MKRVICALVFLCVVISTTQGIVTKTNAEVDTSDKWTLLINDVELNTEDNVLISEKYMLIPLRIVLETLGSTVIWESSTGNVYFDFDGVVYVCSFVALNPDFPEDKSVIICNVSNINSKKSSNYIFLNPMGVSGSYLLINGRTYLYPQAGQRLFEALGCKVEIDLEQNKWSISH